MGDGTKGSPEEESNIVFPGALSQFDRTNDLNPEALAQHEIDSETAYTDLINYLTGLGKNYYDALNIVADKMDGRKRRRLPFMQKPGGQEATWEDHLKIRESGRYSDSYDFRSKLLYDKPSLTSIPTLHSYSVGIDRTFAKHEKGPHPQGLVTVTFSDGNIQKIAIDSRNYHISYSDFDRITAKKLGVEDPSYAQSNTPFGSFLYTAFSYDWANNRFGAELVFPGQGIEPKIVLIHKGGNYKKGFRSSYRFSTKDPQAKPEITFRGTVHPSKRKSFETPNNAGYQDRSLSLSQVKEIYRGAMLLLPGQAASK